MSTEKITGFPALFPEGGLQRNDATARFQLGQIAMDVFGNFYRYIKANEALAVGQCVTAVAKAAWDTSIVVDGALAAAGVYTIHVDGIVTARAAGYYAGYYISQATAAGLGVGYRIKEHAAFVASSEVDVILDDITLETFADDAVLYIHNPYIMEKTDATTELIMGVAIGTITSGYFGWIQVGGHCRRVAAGHSTSAAIVLNEPLAPLASPEGAVQGQEGADEDDIFEASNSPLIALQAVAANTTGYIEAKFCRIV